jgi:predicted nucleotidyltransferase
MATPVIPPHITDTSVLIPTLPDIVKIYGYMRDYEAAKKTPEKDAWNKSHFNSTPWGIGFRLSRKKYMDKVAAAVSRGKAMPDPNNAVALKTFFIAILLNWSELISQLKTTLIKWGYTAEDIQKISKEIWLAPENISKVLADVEKCIGHYESVEEQLEQVLSNPLNEAVEKHTTLNAKLFTKEEVLKDNVREKMLEIVDEFLADLKEQAIKIKVDDILLIGSNASYNYTKNSDIDLHILTNAKAAKYSPEVATALYSAYRSLFNKNLDIKFFEIPLEIFVETEESSRVSNGIYSVKKNRWVKKPVIEDIPDYNRKVLDDLVNKWETKCKNLINDIKADKLKDEKKVVKMLEDIYEKLRKKGISKGEYSEENLAFKELRNKGYLDQLKDYKNELVSKRLSLEETLDRTARVDMYNQLFRAAGTQPIIQDNGTFFIYNLKASDIDRALSAIRKLSFVVEVQANENGKYDFSNTLDLAINKMPKKYYNIRGRIKM